MNRTGANRPRMWVMVPTVVGIALGPWISATAPARAATARRDASRTPQKPGKGPRKHAAQPPTVDALFAGAVAGKSCGAESERGSSGLPVRADDVGRARRLAHHLEPTLPSVTGRLHHPIYFAQAPPSA